MQRYLGLDYAFANTLEVDETTGLLTGQTSGPVVTPQRKRQLLATIANVEGCEIQQTIAVGDGANDIPMLHAAGLGIAFCAKPKASRSCIRLLRLYRLRSWLGNRCRRSRSTGSIRWT